MTHESADPELDPATLRPLLSPWMQRSAAIVIALAAGAGAALAHPPFGIWAGLVGYPLLMWLSEKTATRRGAFGLGWLAGFVYFFISCWWVAEAFLVNAEAHAWMAPFAASLLPAGLALFWGAALATYRAIAPDHVGRALVFAAVFVGFEWLRGHILTGFPWNPAGASWAAGSAPSQAAALFGVYGLSLVTVAGLACLAPLLGPGNVKRRAGMAVLGAVLIAALFIGGSFRLVGANETLTNVIVRVVQPDVAQRDKWDEANFRNVVERYVNLTARPGAGLPDVVVWPEGALPISANDAFAPGSWVGEAMTRSLAPGQTLLAGFARAEPAPEGGAVYRNSLFALRRDAQALRVAAVYDKHRLVPFGEYLPLGSLMTSIGLRSLVHMPSDFTAGPRPQPLELEGLGRVQPLICYEGLYPDLPGQEGGRPAWIVNISNDAWFGRTSGPLQHLNLGAYRAIEEGLPMVRSTPTGVSALIDPWGRIAEDQRLDAGESGVLDLRLPQALPPTLYSRIGDLGFLVLWLMMAAAMIRRPTDVHNLGDNVDPALQ